MKTSVALRFKHACGAQCPTSGSTFVYRTPIIPSAEAFIGLELRCLYTGNVLMMIEIDGKAL